MDEKIVTSNRNQICPKVLCYSPYNMWTLHGLWEITILHTLKLRGAEVNYFLCDGLYKECDLFTMATNPRHALSCIKCQASVTNLMSQMGMPFKWLGRYIMPDDHQNATSWSNGISIEDLEKATYQEWEIGKWVRSSVHTFFRMSELNISQPQVEKAYRNYLYSGLIACFGLSRLLDDYTPDVLFLFNGRQSSTRIAFELARRCGIRVITHDRGRLKESLKLIENGTCSSLKPFKQAWKHWENFPLSSEELDHMDKLFMEREYGRNFNWRSFSPPPQPLDHFYNQLKIPKEKPVWALFTSSDDEHVSEEEWEGVFPKQHDWIVNTANYARRHPEISLIIRVHPNTGGKKASGNNKKQLLELKTLRQHLPYNVRIIMPDDPISSYTLMKAASVGLIYHSTAGLEMASRGKQVVVAAGSFVNNLSFVKTVKAVEDYEPLLDNLLNSKYEENCVDIQRLAYRYTYFLFFRYMVPFPLVKMPNPHHGQLAYNSLDALFPGKEPNLDRIARIILEEEPVCPPPTAADFSRSEDEERKWFENKRQHSKQSIKENVHFTEETFQELL